MPTGGRCFPTYYGGVGVDLDGGGTPTNGGDDQGSGTANPEAAPADASNSDSSACQLGHAPAQRGVLSIALLLGAALGLSRRRAQARG
jgi:hypothetical protein